MTGNGEELAALIRQKKLSPVELVELYLRRIERLGPGLNCFVLVTAEEALERKAGRAPGARG